jgi:hypothetical protein
MFPVVDIATADTCPIYCDKNMVWGFERRFGSLFEGDLEWFIEDEREVLSRKFR